MPSAGKLAAQRIVTLLRFVRHPRYARAVLEPRLRLAGLFMKRDHLGPLEAWRLSVVRPYTLLDFERLSTLRRLVERIIAEGVPGSLVECGSWRGGSGALIGAVARRDESRHVWLLDSWEGFPASTSDLDVASNGFVGTAGACAAPREDAERVLGLLHQRPEAVDLVQGWFEDSIPQVKERMGKIALLHLDGDLYQSTKTCLEELYPAVVPGGFVVIDDYGDWKGCRKAVDEYLSAHGIDVDLVEVDWTGVYFQKPDEPARAAARAAG